LHRGVEGVGTRVSPLTQSGEGGSIPCKVLVTFHGELHIFCCRAMKCFLLLSWKGKCGRQEPLAEKPAVRTGLFQAFCGSFDEPKPQMIGWNTTLQTKKTSNPLLKSSPIYKMVFLRQPS